MLAVVPVRDGVLPLGGLEAVAECGGVALLAGSRPDVNATAGVGRSVRGVELGDFQPARWAAALAPLVAGSAVIVLPASPDGRDLAPRLAHELGRALLAGAIEVTPRSARVSRSGGLALHELSVDEPVVVTLQAGVRGVRPDDAAPHDAEVDSASDVVVSPAPPIDEPTLEQLLPADVATMDLAEAARIAAGGAGLDGPERFRQLARVATGIGAALGATRVVTDRGWLGHERQIGTTGVVVNPSLYLAFGISGAVQHTAGLGDPEHIVSVNTDPHCPMMQLADLAIVSDANAVLDELARLIGADNR
jgi:electron transfer flavoprotein alpha subunit